MWVHMHSKDSRYAHIRYQSVYENNIKFHLVYFLLFLIHIEHCYIWIWDLTFWYTDYRQKLWKEKWVFSIYNFHSSLGIHLLHQKLFLRLLSSSILSFKVLKSFLWSLRAEARAFLGALAFFLGSISCIMKKNGVI